MNKVTRREFLKVSAVAAAGLLAQACAKAPTEAPPEPTPEVKDAAPTATTAPAPEPEAAKEAPMLADMVSSGTLPALDQRLPAEPMVLEVVESIGEYGGTLTWMQGGEPKTPDGVPSTIPKS